MNRIIIIEASEEIVHILIQKYVSEYKKIKNNY